MAVLPDYVASAVPVPKSARIPWYAGTAQTYAGIMLWFVFWQDVPAGEGSLGGTLAQGLGLALVALILAALLCHYLYYLVPGLLGMKTGLPLYIVGTSTYGVRGGFFMPGFLMGVLQFGWLGVNAFFAGWLLCQPLTGAIVPPGAGQVPVIHMTVAAVWAAAAAFLGLKGIQYVARVATFLPLIPLAILLVLFFATVGGIGGSATAIEAGIAAAAASDPAAQASVLSRWGVVAVILTYVLGFFATAGAAGCDFGMNSRDARDVRRGGLVGIAGATIFAGGLSLLIVAGAHGSAFIDADPGVMTTTGLLGAVMGAGTGSVFMYLLAVAAFPPACFSAFIAANSFRTTLPRVNPFVSVGIGTAVSILLAVTGAAGRVVDVFVVIGASFGPVCGAMAADYLLAGRKWAGPRAAFNMAGWISWIVGFAVGAFNLVVRTLGHAELAVIPVPPLSAFLVGFALYYALAKAGMESPKLETERGGASD
jgi:cytosine permease